MADQNLSFFVCVPLFLLFIMVIAVIGMRSRMRYAKDLLTGYKKMQSVGKQQNIHNQTKRRAYLVVALFSLLSILLLSFLIFVQILPASIPILIVCFMLIFFTLLSGIMLLRDIEKYK